MLKRLLSTPTTQLGKAGRLAVFQIKLWSHCARLLRINRADQEAAALSYYTIFGIVPLAIVILLLFHSLAAEDIGQNVKNLIYEHLDLKQISYTTSSGEQVLLTNRLDAIVKQFFEGLNKGSLTFISAVVVIWAALALLSRIENSFNNIWHVSSGRSFLHRIINYWAILTLGPLLIGLGVYVSTQYESIGRLQKDVITFSRIGPTLVSYFFAVIVLFLLYFILPNTKVQAKAAIWGAAVAAVVWTFAKWGFSQYVTEFIPYSKIYGVVGLIPLAVFWIFVTWLIVLFGLQLTFTTQHLKSLDAGELGTARKNEEYFIANDTTAINIVREIALAFEENKAPISPEVIFSKLDMPPEFGEKILNHLVHHNIIVRTSDPALGYLPAKDPSHIRLSDISEALAAAGIAQSTPDMPQSLQHITQSQQGILSQYNLKQILANDTDSENG
jgi:membrane protein